MLVEIESRQAMYFMIGALIMWFFFGMMGILYFLFLIGGLYLYEEYK